MAVGIAGLVVAATGSPAIAVSGATSTTFAGYELTPKKHITSIKEDFVVPSITCKKSFSGVGPAVEVNSVTNKKTNTVITDAAGVGVGCENKTAVLQPIILVDGQLFNDPLTITPGDHVSVAIMMSKSKSSVTLDDTTSDQHATHKGGEFVGGTAFLGASSLDLNKKNLELDPFTQIKVSNAEINGKSLKAAKAFSLTWVKKKTVLVQPGALTHGGKNFTVTFKNSG